MKTGTWPKNWNELQKRVGIGDLTKIPLTACFRWIAWLLVFVVATFTLLPIGFRPVTAAPADLERFIAFAVIGAAFYLGYPNHHVGFVLLAAALAGLLEVLQNFVPGRHGHFHDYAIKAGGVFLGALVARILERKARKASHAEGDPD